MKKYFGRTLALRLSQGFTLIELLIVIAVIGILSGLIITNVQGVRERARDARRKSDLNALQQSLRLYYHDANAFPLSNNFSIEGCGTILAPSVCSWGTGTFAITQGGNLTTYMAKLPSDPSSSTGNPLNYKYYSPSGDNYIIVSHLENLSDQDIANSQLQCPVTYALYASTGSNLPTQDYVVCEE